MRVLLLVPLSVAWTALESGTVVFELVALALAGLVAVEIAEARGSQLPGWLPTWLGPRRPVHISPVAADDLEA